ncbi:hypothetical protein ACWED2_10725 [Amycolatopsis sp. NPDC005003]
MNISEDELEQRLRALFADERLDLPPPPDAGTVIVTGARRRRRRRHAVQAVAGVAAAAVAVAGGLTVFRVHTEDGTAAMSAPGTGASTKPPENLTQGRPPEPSTPGPTGTQSIQASAPPGSSTSTPPRRPSATPAPSTLADVTSGPLLAADGFGKLKLGMSEADVAAQKVTLSDPRAGAGCTVYKAQGAGVPVSASVVISKAAGLVVVTPDVAAHTAEGIGAGSTKDQILAAYPAAKAEAGGVVAPAGTAAEYRFRLGETGVVQTSLTSAAQDCAG